VLRLALGVDCALPAGSRVLVAASGGADSTALLAGLCRIANEFGLEIEAAHLNHRLRGRDADLDMAAVGALCKRIGVRLTAARWNTRDRMRRRGLAGQNGLRTLRREFLLTTAKARGCDAIATAHTADDQLETLLMRLARGTGVAGLAGIRPRSGRVVRPLLLAPRAWIEADLERAGIAWREDPSNADPRYARSRIRHEVVPRLVSAARAPSAGPGRAGPAASAALALRAARAAADVARSETFLRSRANRALRAVSRIQPGAVDLDSTKVAPWPSALRRTVLREAWRMLAGTGTGLTSRHLEALDRLIVAGRSGARVALPGGGGALRERGRVRLSLKRGPAIATRTERTLRGDHPRGQTGAVERGGR
jgi:tRNA(Ile)-lysidine synthase